MGFSSRSLRLTVGIALAAAAAGGAVWVLIRPAHTSTLQLEVSSAEASAAEVHQFCSRCHVYPPADALPRAVWRKEVRQAYDFFRQSPLTVDFPPLESVALYYEKRAPHDLPPAAGEPADGGPCPVAFEKQGASPARAEPFPGVSNVNLVHLFDAGKLDVLVCDMRGGAIDVWSPYATPPAWRNLGKVAHPGHAEIVDLDGDGRKDIIVADLGYFTPTNERLGKVIWLRAQADGTFTPVTLLEGVGRVADVQAADFNGDGKLDLVVAVFGWRETGAILYLENQTSDWSQPRFVPHVIDERHGAIHVPVADLNGDGKPDFVGLISQEHEAVVAYLNEGGGRFRKATLHAAPHPVWGYSGMQLADLDGDGDLDVLLTNGDVLQEPYLVKPYHGIDWLENKGNLRFEHHHLVSMPGVMRAVAADVDGDGRKDVIAVAFLPAERFPQRREKNLSSVILLRQTTPGRFVRHTLESITCEHLTCAAGDIFGDGRTHFVTGNFSITPSPAIRDAVTLWRNARRAERREPPGDGK